MDKYGTVHLVDDDPHYPDVRRIAVALERIADVLEKHAKQGVEEEISQA